MGVWKSQWHARSLVLRNHSRQVLHATPFSCYKWHTVILLSNLK